MASAAFRSSETKPTKLAAVLRAFTTFSTLGELERHKDDNYL